MAVGIYKGKSVVTEKPNGTTFIFPFRIVFHNSKLAKHKTSQVKPELNKKQMYIHKHNIVVCSSSMLTLALGSL